MIFSSAAGNKYLIPCTPSFQVLVRLSLAELNLHSIMMTGWTDALLQSCSNVKVARRSISEDGTVFSCCEVVCVYTFADAANLLVAAKTRSVN